ncbi:MAG: FRG domain-containing protein [Planctomycetota bacterium]
MAKKKPKNLIHNKLPHNGIDFTKNGIDHNNLFSLIRCWNDLREKAKEQGINLRIYFRGEYESHPRDKPNDIYKLQPALLRKDNLTKMEDSWFKLGENGKDIHDLEVRVFERYKRYTAHLIEETGEFAGRSLQNLEILCMAQHHDLPTMLLDWSLNPFVALYFALTGATGDLHPRLSRLWVMILKQDSERVDRTIHLEQTRYLHPHDHIVDLALESDGEPWTLRTGENQLAGFTGNGQRFNAWHWFKQAPFIVVPLVFTKRIAAQSGRFVYCSNLSSSEDRLDKIITRHHLSEDNRWQPLDIVNPDSNTLSILEPYNFTNYSDLSDNSNSFQQLIPTEICKENWSDYLAPGVSNTVPLHTLEGDVGQSPWARLLCYPINTLSTKQHLLSTLDTVGFHAGRLFPDLSGWAKYIKQGYK